LSRNILILGGSYFAGWALVEHLVKEKEGQVYTFNRGNIPLNLSEVNEMYGDRTDPFSVRHDLLDRTWDVLIDFCAYEPEDVEMVLESMNRTPGQYIFVSTTSVYDHSAMLPLDETSPTLDGPQLDLGEYAFYAFDKLKTEKRLEQICRKKFIPWTILRPSILYGRFNYAPREDYFFEQIEKGEPLVVPDPDLALFSFLYVADFAKIITDCIGNPDVYDTVLNAVSDEYVSYRTYIQTLAKISGKKIRTVRMSVANIEKERIPLPFSIDQHQIYSGTRLYRKLGFQPTPLVLGMKKTYEFYKSDLKKRER
jgi:nucleoside-diphosphate-sugar epimerase